jgi:GrpB-like predicted nucleotidyltransferase (UPF0157 family)
MAETERPRPIVLAAPDPDWRVRFVVEVKILREVLGAGLLAVHHIGSTAVPSLWSQPTVDIMPVARTLDGVDAARANLEAAGYQWQGEHGLCGRRSLVRTGSDGAPAVYVQIFEPGHREVPRHLAFRDHLIARPLVASSYERLKRDLARGNDPAAYAAAKSAFIEAALREAMGRAYTPPPH